MNKEHHIVYIPGLRDQWVFNRGITKILPAFWDKRGFPLHKVAPHWEDGKTLEPKLEMVTSQIDYLITKGYKVSIIGQSAGGSLGLIAFCLKRDSIVAAINATGRLRQGEGAHPTLDQAALHSPAFKQSVQLFENELEPTLTAEDRKRIMTLRPWWDESVPASTVPLKDATNRIVRVPEHTLAGVYIMTLYSKILQEFLNSKMVKT